MNNWAYLSDVFSVEDGTLFTIWAMYISEADLTEGEIIEVMKESKLLRLVLNDV